MKKAIAILLAVCFVLTLTASAVSAHRFTTQIANVDSDSSNYALAINAASPATAFNGLSGFSVAGAGTSANIQQSSASNVFVGQSADEFYDFGLF